MLKILTKDTLVFDWSKFHPRGALLCIPALAIPILVGVATGYPRQGVMGAAGAFSVGFGSFQELLNSRRKPMLIAAVGMCISSWVGTLAGLSSTATVLISASWGVLYGTVWTLSPATAWIALQCVIWLVISTAYPASGLKALTRGSFVLGGGLLQMLCVSAAWKITGSVAPVAAKANPAQERGILSHAKQATLARRLQALRAGVILALGAGLYRWLRLPNGYWVPMTAAIVMKPEFEQTFQRGLARVLGTLAGAALATLIATSLQPSPWILAGLVLMFALFCYLFIYVNYAMFAVCLTSYVVFLLSLAGLPENVLIAHRAMNTLMGGAIALVVHAVFSPIEKSAKA